MSNDEQQTQIDSQEGAHEENRLIAERRAKLAELRDQTAGGTREPSGDEQ